MIFVVKGACKENVKIVSISAMRLLGAESESKKKSLKRMFLRRKYGWKGKVLFRERLYLNKNYWIYKNKSFSSSPSHSTFHISSHNILYSPRNSAPNTDNKISFTKFAARVEHNNSDKH